MQNLTPLLCFPSYYVEENLLRLLGATQANGAANIQVSNCTVDSIRLGRETVHSTTFRRIAGGRLGMLNEVAQLARVFKGPILYFDKDVTHGQLDESDARSLPNLYIVNNVNLIPAVLNITLTPDQTESIRKLLLEDYRPLRVPRPPQPGAEEMGLKRP